MINKIIFITLFLYILFCPTAWSLTLPEWEQIYGVELANIPLPLRQQFMLATGQAWADASLEEQCSFLDERAKQKKERVREREALAQDKEAEKLEIAERNRRRLDELERKRLKEVAKLTQENIDRENRIIKRRLIVEKRQQMMKNINEKNRSH